MTWIRCGVRDRRRVAGQDSYARAILRAVETGACDARPDLTAARLRYNRRSVRLMPNCTYPAHVCTVPRAVSHTWGTNLPDIRIRWTKDRRTIERTGLVYYFERADGAVKIGCTVNYPQRRQALTQRHGRLRLVAWEFGYSDVEAYRHRQFAHLRIDPIAEWFRVDCDLYDHILSLLAVL